jgi:hypothetical protein
MSALIAYAALEQKIAAVFARIRDMHADYNVTQYASHGAGDNAPRWRTLGFYARTSPNARLVCEAFHDQRKSAAVIRVYREGTVEPLFAKKWAGDDARFCEAVDSAADTFVEALPPTPCPAEPDDDMSWLPLSDEQRKTFERALIPIPPPFSLAATQEA